VAAPYDAEVPTTSRSATLQRSSERFVTVGRLYVALLTCNVPDPACTTAAQRRPETSRRRAIPCAG
jgi:hypothetical protein